jgi:hypothetical protein
MDLSLPPGMERLPLHRAHLEAACLAAMEHEDIVGMVIGGSFASEEADEYSDLDLQLAVEPEAFDEVAANLPGIAKAAGTIVAAFTAEHIGLPAMLIVLYDDLVHADFQPVAVPGIGERNAGLPAFLLWERAGRIRSSLSAQPPKEDAAAQVAWFEARMWTWSWYIQAKVLRGELHEALDGLQYVRGNVLFRLLAMHRGELSSGARRAEQRMGAWMERFDATVPVLTRESALDALRATMSLYMEFADPLLERHEHPPAEDARRVVLAALEAGLDWRPSSPAGGS